MMIKNGAKKGLRHEAFDFVLQPPFFVWSEDKQTLGR